MVGLSFAISAKSSYEALSRVTFTISTENIQFPATGHGLQLEGTEVELLQLPCSCKAAAVVARDDHRVLAGTWSRPSGELGD